MPRKRRSQDLNRREFIGQASCAAIGSTALFSSLLSLRMTSSAAAAEIPEGDDYKALVCIFLAGGNDSFNMLAPRQSDAYAQYALTRDNIALPNYDLNDPTNENNLLPISSEGQAFSEFGLHPGVGKMRDLYDEGHLAFIANVGTLIRPTTLEDYQARNFLPQGLFSHSDQVTHWQTSVPSVRGAGPGGWGGRTADLLASLNADAEISMNISLSGLNVFQTGENAFAYVTGRNGATEMVSYDDPFEQAAIDSMLDLEYKNLFQSTFAKNSRRYIDSSIAFNEAISDVEITTLFPPTTFGENLKAVARAIAAQDKLKMKRQTFFVKRGGWDHHNEVLNNQAALLPEISEGINSFWNALGEIGMQDKVVLFSASDFGRTLSSNGVGSDHAWGGNQFALGGPVKGGRIYGTYPEISLGSGINVDSGRGRLIPTTSVDEYSAELACWFGVGPGELDTVFPNIANFYDPYSLDPPLGFLL